MSAPDVCGPLEVGKQLVGRRECRFHAGGGAASLPCNFDDDPPCYRWLASGTKVRAYVEGRGTVQATVVRSIGDTEDRRYEIRVGHERATVEVSGGAVEGAMI